MGNWENGSNGPVMPESSEQESKPIRKDNSSIINVIGRAYDALSKAKTELYEVSELELASKEALKHREAELVLNGAVVGKNEQARQAELVSLTATERRECEEMRKAKARVLLFHEIAQLEVDRLKWLIRAYQAGA